MEQKNNSKRGGARPNSGRPRKDRSLWKQITCVLRADTIEKIKAGAGGGNARFSQFLQDHLDEHPLPSREAYLSMQRLKALKAEKRFSNSAWDREVRRVRRQERERQRLERSLASLSKKERALMAWASKQVPGPEKAKKIA